VAYGIAADKLLTVGRELQASGEHQFERGDRWLIAALLWLHRRTVSSGVEGLFTVLMCDDCRAARGHGSSPYPS
jgi:hypothetical protein